MIINADRKFLINEDQMSQDFFVWSREVTDKLNFLTPATGAGSPEGVVTAEIGKFYIDTTAAPGSVLYVKQFGSGSTGWVLT